jgi:hypothetical protein
VRARRDEAISQQRPDGRNFLCLLELGGRDILRIDNQITHQQIITLGTRVLKVGH